MQARSTLRASAGHLVEGVMRGAQLLAAVDPTVKGSAITKAEWNQVAKDIVRHAGLSAKLGADVTTYTELAKQNTLLADGNAAKAVIDAIFVAVADAAAKAKAA